LIYAARPVASNQRQRRGGAGLQRLALLGSAALLVVLFLIFAIAEGIGDPSVPSGDVAVVEDAPDGLGTITKEDLDHAIEQAAAESQVKPVPKPGDPKYDELQEAALGQLFDSIWIQGLGEEMGFTVTPKEVSDELAKLKKQAFKSEKQYNEFLKEGHYTQADVNERVKVQIISTKVQEQITEEGSTPSSDEIEEYYEAAKSSQFTTPESRDVRTIANKDKAKVEEAKELLLKDDSPESWKKVAKKYSTEATKGNGGLQAGLTEGRLPEPLNAEVFAAGQGEVLGPVKGASTYTIFEVEKITPEKVQSLDEAKSQISTQLSEQAQQKRFAAVIGNWRSTWTARTFCASDFVIERCANFEGEAHPAEASPACYEADPKTPATECPSPVTPIKPALPGSVTLQKPEGEPFVQRPLPESSGAAAEGTTELPPGATPEEAPPAEAPPAESGE
jgi:parvulin-like peptidyl-prolyl isomerase